MVLFIIYMFMWWMHFFLEETRSIFTLAYFEQHYNEWTTDPNIERMEFWFSPYTSIIPKEYSSSPPVVGSFYRKTTETPPAVIDGHNGGQARGSYALVFAGAAISTLCSNRPLLKPLMAFVQCVALQQACHKALPMSAVDALDFGTANYMPTNAIGVGFDYNLAIDAVKDYHDLLVHLEKKKKNYITSPYALRFCKPSTGTICISHQKDPCAWIEQPLLDFNKTYLDIWHKIGDTGGAMDTYSEIFNLLLNDKYLGIVHWGLWFDVKRKNLWGHINTNEFKIIC